MEFFPTDLTQIAPSQGFGTVPPGYYILQVDAVDVQPTKKDPNKSQVQYKSKILQGPDASMDYANTPFTDFILFDQAFMGQHKQLLISCYGSEAALLAEAQRAYQLGPDGKPRLAPQLAIGRRYLAKIGVRKYEGEDRNQVSKRLPVEDLSKELGQEAGGFSAGAMSQFARNAGAPPSIPAGVPTAGAPPLPATQMAAPPPPPPPPAAPQRTFFVALNGQAVKKTEDEVRQLLSQGFTGPVVLEGESAWKTPGEYGITAGAPAIPGVPPPPPIPGR